MKSKKIYNPRNAFNLMLMSKKVVKVLNLGAGVQSSTIALMIENGELPMVDYAIFSDTGAEPGHVYDYLDYLEKLLSYPVYRVMKESGLREHLLKSIKDGRFAGPPFYTESSKNPLGGMLRRQCTREFKIEPIHLKIRELAGLKKGERAKKKLFVINYMGISTDEITRAKDPHESWMFKFYPLIEFNMSRHDCIKWLKKNNYKVPQKSACTFCPYHDNKTWREIKMNDPHSWGDALKIDEMIRNGTRGTTNKLYLHSSLKPLADIDFRNESDMGQLNFFENECEGMCGV